MPLFEYKVINKDGKTVEGKMEAKDRFSLYHTIKQDGSTVISANEIKEKGVLASNLSLPFKNKVKTHDKIIFAKNLAKMLEAGLPLTRGLAIMEKQSKGRLKIVLNSLSESLSKGNTLSDSMKDYPDVFSSLFVSMVRAGEESGNLSMSLMNIGNQMEKTYQLTKKVRGAMMYPAVIVCLMVVIGVLMMVYMVPTLTETFVGLGVKLPLPTRIIIAISNFLQSYFVYVVAGTVGLVISLASFLKTVTGKRLLDYLFLKTPIINEIVKQVNSARTARTLSSLIASGVDIVVAIGVTKDIIQNSYYKEVLEKIQSAIQKGEPISSVFSENHNLYPMFVGEMVAVGEETGKIGDMLVSVASFYEEEIDQKTKDMSSVIEPILMIFIGIAVGIFAISMLGPTYSLADAIN